MTEVFLTEEELAKRWKKSIRTIRQYRADGNVPKFTMIGNSARYYIDSIMEWESGKS